MKLHMSKLQVRQNAKLGSTAHIFEILETSCHLRSLTYTELRHALAAIRYHDLLFSYNKLVLGLKSASHVSQ